MNFFSLSEAIECFSILFLINSITKLRTCSGISPFYVLFVLGESLCMSLFSSIYSEKALEFIKTFISIILAVLYFVKFPSKNTKMLNSRSLILLWPLAFVLPLYLGVSLSLRYMIYGVSLWMGAFSMISQSNATKFSQRINTFPMVFIILTFISDTCRIINTLSKSFTHSGFLMWSIFISGSSRALAFLDFLFFYFAARSKIYEPDLPH